MKLRNYLAVFLAVAALALAPTSANAGGGKSGGGGGNKTGCNGPGNDCNTSFVTTGPITVQNLVTGDVANVSIEADRVLNDVEVNVVKDVTLTTLNLLVCSSTGNGFSGEQCTATISDNVTTVIVNDFANIYLNKVTVVLNTLTKGSYKNEKKCGCQSKK